MNYHARIHEDSDRSYWAEVDELPGLFAAGGTLEEVKEALFDAIELYTTPSEITKAKQVVARKPKMKMDELQMLVTV